MRLFLLVCIFIGVVGCSFSALKKNETHPGVVSVSSSDFDGLTEIKMNPVYAYSKAGSREVSSVKFGMLWSNRFEQRYMLYAQMSSPSWFDASEPIRLKVAGVEYALQPSDPLSIGTSMQEVIRYENEYAVSYSRDVVVRKRYYVSRDFLDLLIEENVAIGRVVSTKGFVDFSLGVADGDHGDYSDSYLFISSLGSFLKDVDDFTSQGSRSQ